ncbi:MAG: hypothetical protein VXW65_06580 [Pseudomonadota bacterium]|nr:hypothetical protein [Pseudomonadota bacterium]
MTEHVQHDRKIYALDDSIAYVLSYFPKTVKVGDYLAVSCLAQRDDPDTQHLKIGLAVNSLILDGYLDNNLRITQKALDVFFPIDHFAIKSVFVRFMRQQQMQAGDAFDELRFVGEIKYYHVWGEREWAFLQDFLVPKMLRQSIIRRVGRKHNLNLEGQQAIY